MGLYMLIIKEKPGLIRPGFFIYLAHEKEYSRALPLIG